MRRRDSQRKHKIRDDSRERSRQKPRDRQNRDPNKQHRNRNTRDYHNERDRRHQNQKQQRAEHQVEQQNGCPFLVRVMYSQSATTNFDGKYEQTKDNELMLHLRKSTTLIQIVQLFRAHMPQFRFKPKYVVSKLHENSNNNNKGNNTYIKQQIGTVLVDSKTLPQIVHLSNNININKNNNTNGTNNNMGTNVKNVTLADIGFQIGDRIGICVLLNKHEREPLIPS